jgi:glycine betaine/proline transport system permease protein
MSATATPVQRPTETMRTPDAPAGGDRGTPWFATAKFGLPAVLVVWIIGSYVLNGKQTLAIGRAEVTDFQKWLTSVKDNFDVHRADSFILNTVFGGISDFLQSVVEFFQNLLSTAPAGRPYAEIGFLGVLALFVFIALAFAGVRSAILVLVGTVAFAWFGAWTDSIDTIIITFVAVVFCAVIGVPIGIWMARSKWASSVITPILDVLQTMPAFAYLAPLTLLFTIGPAAAVALTMLYAISPLIRITAHGIRTVSSGTLEAADSLGSTRRQKLLKVQLPMARRTIVVGLNQCTMAALSMATIAALVDGPGLGGPVVQALQSLDIGAAFVSGLLIVVIAIMLDRSTTAASERSEKLARAGKSSARRRRLMLAGAGVVTVVLVYLSHTKVWAAEVPSTPALAKPTADAVNTFTDNVVNAIEGFTSGVKDIVTYALINPLQSLLADSPFWLTGLAIILIAFLLGGWRPAVITLVCEAVILGTGLWNDSMQTLTSTLVATLLTVAIAMGFGVWMGRNRRIDAGVRPFLDALQTIPPFVYLIPALALFDPSRFTAIVAAIAYGVPIATKLVADGIRGVSPTSVEAARAAGTTSWQMITKVQLPMARSAVVLATNQGLLYVLSMVVIGGLVGGGGLGYLVVAGFSQGQLFGKGLAAGIAITALGVMLDRIAQHAAARHGRARG